GSKRVTMLRAIASSTIGKTAKTTTRIRLAVLMAPSNGRRPHEGFAGFRPRVAGASRAKDDLDVDPVRHLNAHELTKGPLVRIEVDEPLVDPHLPAVPRLAPL